MKFDPVGYEKRTAILKEYNAGERDLNKLAEKYDYPEKSIRKMLEYRQLIPREKPKPREKLIGYKPRKRNRVRTIWHGIKQRCYNPGHTHYHRYGGRGIIMCDEWKNNFSTFYYWAIDNGYAENLSIDRISNDGNYEPTNCQWVTIAENCKKQSTNKFITYNGKTQIMADWAREFSMHQSVFFTRLKKGFTMEEISKMPPSKSKNVLLES